MLWPWYRSGNGIPMKWSAVMASLNDPNLILVPMCFGCTLCPSQMVKRSAKGITPEVDIHTSSSVSQLERIIDSAWKMRKPYTLYPSFPRLRYRLQGIPQWVVKVDSG